MLHNCRMYVPMSIYISGTIAARVAKFGDIVSYYYAQIKFGQQFSHAFFYSLKSIKKINCEHSFNTRTFIFGVYNN